jgi:hypothetical protein
MFGVNLQILEVKGSKCNIQGVGGITVKIFREHALTCISNAWMFQSILGTPIYRGRRTAQEDKCQKKYMQQDKG